MRSPAKSSPLRSVSSRESLHSPPNSPGTRTNFRSHTEFHRFPLSGTADELLVTYTNDVRVANQWIQDFVLVLVEEQKQKQKFPWIPVGFDLEWKPTFRAGEASNKVSLMQLAVPGNRVLLFQLRGFSHSPRSHWACSAQRLGFDGKALGHVLRAQGPFLKVGVSLNHDFCKLKGDYEGLQVGQGVDLMELAKHHHRLRWETVFRRHLPAFNQLERFRNWYHDEQFLMKLTKFYPDMSIPPQVRLVDYTDIENHQHINMQSIELFCQFITDHGFPDKALKATCAEHVKAVVDKEKNSAKSSTSNDIAAADDQPPAPTPPAPAPSIQLQFPTWEGPAEVHLPRLSSRTKYSLDALSERYTGHKLPKTRGTQTSNWEVFPLSLSQIKYAAMDAWAGRNVFDTVMEEIKACLHDAADERHKDLDDECAQLIRRLII